MYPIYIPPTVSVYLIIKTYSFFYVEDDNYPSKPSFKKTLSSGSSDNQSRKSIPSEDKNYNQNRFPSTVTSKKENDDINYSSKIQRSASNSSEDFFGIKRSSSQERKKNTRSLEDDFFETESANDQLNVFPTTTTKSWRDNSFFDQNGMYHQ